MHIALVGLSGVPYLKRACDYRILAFCELFSSIDWHVTVINRISDKRGKLGNAEETIYKKIDIIESIENEKISKHSYNGLARIISYMVEIWTLFKLNRKKKIDVMHVYSGHYIECVIYRIISRAIGAKNIYNYVEYRSALKREGIYHKYNSLLMDGNIVRLFDGVICITSYLERKINNKSRKVPTIVIPAICDYEYFDRIGEGRKTESKYIIFCGSAGYRETIELVIEAWRKSKCKDRGIGLKLIISGKESEVEEIRRKRINEKEISIETGLPYDELIRKYKECFAAIIPMFNTEQDKARFPNKVCEYSATKSLIVTTRYGEIQRYFKDRKSALIARDCKVESIAMKLDEAIENENENQNIRKEAYKVGIHNFNIKAYRERMKKYLERVLS